MRATVRRMERARSVRQPTSEEEQMNPSVTL